MLPQDPFILLSFVNTQLRDRFPSLAAFCEDYDIDPQDLTDKLGDIGFQYDAAQNCFHP